MTDVDETNMDGAIEGIAPSIYFSHDAGIWRHVSDLFDPEWFKLLMKGNGSNSIKTVEQWGKWLSNSKNYGKFQGQNCGRVVFEKLVSEGHARHPKLPSGALSKSGIDPYVDYVAKTGKNIQLKHSLGKHVDPSILNGKYSPANGVDAVGVNTESYREIISNPTKYGFTETSPSSGIAIHGENGTKVINSGLNSDTSRNILTKAQDHARDNLKAFDITEHLAINAMKAAGIAALLNFAFKGSINLYKYSHGNMRGDDAVDSTVGSTLKAAVTGGVTTFVAGGIMAVIGIPTAGLGLVVAIPVGVATGLVVSKAVNTSFDMIYNELMGGRFIQIAREQNKTLSLMFDNLTQHFEIAESFQERLNKKAESIPDIPWEDFYSTITKAELQIEIGNRFLSAIKKPAQNSRYVIDSSSY